MSREAAGDLVHRYQRGLHHQSVDECPDCGDETYACKVQLTWYDPADIVVREAAACGCYRPRGVLNRLRWWVKNWWRHTDTDQGGSQ
ncbi:hypothetical protein GCM10009030_39880 [Haloarcula pellucida]|uniref:Uncharacterized protein n=1 Tax=Haloarcula pellucida TaxID=1427151 RepID=A0A830GV13_9EURY|nr:hypothetical protein GCM10009030_39880 [Halomicroarcula pellucida]